MHKLSKTLFKWIKKIGILLIILLIVYFVPIHRSNLVNNFLSHSLVILILTAFAIAITGFIIGSVLKIRSIALSKLIGLKFSSVSKDGKCFRYHHKPILTLKEIFNAIFFRNDNTMDRKKIKAYEEDISKVARWLKNNPEVVLITNTHGRVGKFLMEHGEGLIKLILIEEGERPNKIDWMVLRFLTTGKIRGKRPTDYYKYKIERVNN